MLGMSIGNVIGPFITEYLLRVFGWRGATLILSAIVAHQIPLGLTFWSPEHVAEAMRTRKQSHQNATFCDKCMKLLKESFNFELFRGRLFVLYCLGNFLQAFASGAYYSHLPSFTVYRGYDLQTAAFIMSVVFISNSATRIVISFVANMKCVDLMGLYTVGNILGSIAAFILLIDTYPGLVVGAALHGVMLGRFYS